jgi:hypothetical protein
MILRLNALRLGAFAKLRKATLRFIMMSVCLSAWNNSAPTGGIFVNLMLSIFQRSVKKIQVLLKLAENNRVYEDQYTFVSHLAQLFLEREMFQTKVVDIFHVH